MKRLITCILLVCMLCLTTSVSFADDKAGKINLNTATKEQLVSIGIDAEMVDSILELLKENGEFVDIEELMDVDGMDAKMLRQLKKKVYIEAAKGCNC